MGGTRTRESAIDEQLLIDAISAILQITLPGSFKESLGER